MTDKEEQTSYRYNSEILIAEMIEFEAELWDNNELCRCGANSHHQCTCGDEKIKSYKQRAGRKIEDRFGLRALQMMAKSREMSLRR